MNKGTYELYEESRAEGDRLNSFRALDQMGKNLTLFDRLIGKPDVTDIVLLLEQLLDLLPHDSEYREAIMNVRSRRRLASG